MVGYGTSEERESVGGVVEGTVEGVVEGTVEGAAAAGLASSSMGMVTVSDCEFCEFCDGCEVNEA